MLLLVSCLLQSAAVLGAVTKIGSGCTSREGQLRFCVNATMENDVMTCALYLLYERVCLLVFLIIGICR